MAKNGKRAKGTPKIKDLDVKRTATAVKGGRTVRITNVRANAVAIGVSTTFTTAQIQAGVRSDG